MKKARMMSVILSIVGIMMISMGLVIDSEQTLSQTTKIKFEEIDMKSVAASTNMIIKKNNDNSEVVINNKNEEIVLPLKEVNMETVPASIIIPPRIEVYDGLTIEELSEKFDRMLGTSYLQGKGNFIATYALNNGVDPYIGLAIILHETGCGSGRCSNLTTYCNNVGGQKGSPGCNGGAYKQFPTLDEGIMGFINNLNRNYFSMGLNTVESIAPKYAESQEWPNKINWYVNKIRNS